MRIVWTSPALRQLSHIARYIEGRDPAAASRLMRRIETAVDHLSRFPRLGRAGRMPKTRELTITGTRYIAVYAIQRERIEVLAVFHERQNRSPTAPKVSE